MSKLYFGGFLEYGVWVVWCRILGMSYGSWVLGMGFGCLVWGIEQRVRTGIGSGSWILGTDTAGRVGTTLC